MDFKFCVNYDVRLKDGQIDHRSTSILDNKQDADFIFDGRAEDPDTIELQLWELTPSDPKKMVCSDYNPREFKKWRLVRIFTK